MKDNVTALIGAYAWIIATTASPMAQKEAKEINLTVPRTAPKTLPSSQRFLPAWLVHCTREPDLMHAQRQIGQAGLHSFCRWIG
jgi:hypothetical protein